MNSDSLQLFDTASLYFRAFFGLPSSLTGADGRPVNAVRGLLDFMARFITEYRPTHVVACWDNSWRPAWRVELVPSYKAHRVLGGDVEVVPDELTPQVPLIRGVLDALGIPILGVDGFEADDVIGTLATSATMPVDIVTGDRDLFQLVDDSRGVRVLSVTRGVARHERVTDATLLDKYGIIGAGYADFATLRGDASDGLPGVSGIGDKTASQLIRDHVDLEGVLEAASQGRLSAGLAAKLGAAVDYLAAAREVVRVRTDVPVGVTADDLVLRRSPADPENFAALTELLNLGGSADRILKAMAG
ncbi:MAG: 5'-3' exonuclease [Micropruina sp.]